jgi:hypothetical protein
MIVFLNYAATIMESPMTCRPGADWREGGRIWRAPSVGAQTHLRMMTSRWSQSSVQEVIQGGELVFGDVRHRKPKRRSNVAGNNN